MSTRRIHYELHGIPRPEGTFVERGKVFLVLDDGTQKKHKVNVGFLSSEDRHVMTPNDNFRLFFPSVWNAAVENWYALEHSLKMGMYAFCLGTEEKSGLYALFRERAGEKVACALLDAAMYFYLPGAGKVPYQTLMERELTFLNSPRENQAQGILKELTPEIQREVEEGLLSFFAGREASLLVCAEHNCLAAVSQKDGRPLFVLPYGKKEGIEEALKETASRLSAHEICIKEVFCTEEEVASSCQGMGAPTFFLTKVDAFWSQIRQEAAPLKRDYGKLISSRGVFAGELSTFEGKEESFSLLIYEEPLNAKATRDICRRLAKEEGVLVSKRALAMEGFSILEGSERIEAKQAYFLIQRAALLSGFLAKAEGKEGIGESLPLVALAVLSLGENLRTAGEEEGREVEDLIRELEAMSFTLVNGIVYAPDLVLNPLQKALLERAGMEAEDLSLLAEDVNRRYSQEEADYVRPLPELIRRAKVKHRGRKPKLNGTKDTAGSGESRKRGRPLGHKNKATLEWEEQIKVEAEELGVSYEWYLEKKRRERDAQKRRERLQNKTTPKPEKNDNTERRGRGRPKGRKNNKTLEREAQERLQEEQAREAKAQKQRTRSKSPEGKG